MYVAATRGRLEAEAGLEPMRSPEQRNVNIISWQRQSERKILGTRGPVMLQRGLCKSIRSIQHDEHKPETRGRSSTSNSIMRKVQRRRRGPELATLQSLNNCNVEPRATRTYGDLHTKVCERTFFLWVRVKEARTLAGQKVRPNRPFATWRATCIYSGQALTKLATFQS